MRKSFYKILTIMLPLVAYGCGSSTDTESTDVVSEAPVENVEKDKTLNMLVESTSPDTLPYMVYRVNDRFGSKEIFVKAEKEYNTKEQLKNTALKAYFLSYPKGDVTLRLLPKDTTQEWLAMVVKKGDHPLRISYSNPDFNDPITKPVAATSVVSQPKLTEKQELMKLLEGKGIVLCDLYKKVGVMERQNGIMADRKYPYDAVKRSEFQESLNEYGRGLLKEKHGIDDLTLVQVNWYGIEECE